MVYPCPEVIACPPKIPGHNYKTIPPPFLRSGEGIKSDPRATISCLDLVRVWGKPLICDKEDK